MGGVGAEVAKNLVLAGPRAVTLWDPAPVASADLGSNVRVLLSGAPPPPLPSYHSSPLPPTPPQFFLRDSDLGRRRDEATLPRLQALNPKAVTCAVLAGSGPGVAAVLQALNPPTAVVATGLPRAEAERINAACRALRVPFICCAVYGVYGFAFADFGDEWRVEKPAGASKKLLPVKGVRVSREVPTACTICETPDPVGCALECVHCTGAMGWICPQCSTSATDAVCAACTFKPGKVVTVTTSGSGLAKGDVASFRGIGGATALNDGPARKVVASRWVNPEDTEQPSEWALDFSLADAEGDGPGWTFSSGGFLERQVQPAVVRHASLATRAAEDLDRQPLAVGQGGEPGLNAAMHAAFAGVEAWRSAHGGALPPVRNATAVTACVDFARAAAPGFPDAALLERVARRVAALAAVELPALAAFFGGVVAQEAIKATRVGTPLNQWLFWEAAAVLSPGGDPGAPLGGAPQQPTADFEPEPAGSRYDGVIAILGRPLQERVKNARVFLVGAGALGCEFLKNFALMGVGTGETGEVTVTDMDVIEVSNLSRQFLFLDGDVGKFKSVAAAAAARSMNPDLKVTAFNTQVGPATETVFDDPFWKGLSTAVMALDNVEARLYVDGQCIHYGKPLLESATEGLKFSTLPVLPRATATYSDRARQGGGGGGEDAGIPLCTLKTFPYLPDHCVAWGLDKFTSAFNHEVAAAAKFVANPAAWQAENAKSPAASRRAAAEAAASFLAAAVEASFEAFVGLACDRFHAHFYTGIRQLLHTLPPDAKDDKGMPVWSGSRRLPSPLPLDASNDLHLGFVTHAAALFAAAAGVEVSGGFPVERVKAAVAAIAPRLPAFAERVAVIKAGEDDEREEGQQDDEPAAVAAEAHLEKLRASLRTALTPAAFEKDIDANHHVDFVAAASNLRALNYRIPTLERHEMHAKAGKIIPAVATATCAATGAACVELYKILGGADPAALRKVDSANLEDGGRFALFPPEEPTLVRSTVETRAYPEGFSRWDKLEVNQGGARDLTWAELSSHFEGLGLCLSGLVYHGALCFSEPADPRSTLTVKAALMALIERRRGTPEALPPLVEGRGWVRLDAIVEDAVVPPVVYYWDV